MHVAQDSICASGPETEQVRVGPDHLPGEREGPRHFLIHCYPSPPPWAQEAGPEGVSLPPEGHKSVYPETFVIISSPGPEGKEKGFY